MEQEFPISHAVMNEAGGGGSKLPFMDTQPAS